MSKSKKTFLVLALAFVAALSLAMIGFSAQNAKQADAEDITSVTVTGVQVRSTGNNDSYNFIVLQASEYSSVTRGTDVSNTETYNTKSKVKIYTSADDTEGKYLTDICGSLWIQNLWGSSGLMLAVNDYATYNGSTIYKIEIEEGCQLPCGNAVYETAETFVFVNGDFGKSEMKNGANEHWTRILGKATLSGIQVRSGGEARRNYIVLLSDEYTGTTNVENIDTSLVTYDKIKIYTSSEATPVALSDIFNGHIDQTVWTQPGLFLNIKDYDKYNGSAIYKVAIEKDCEFPIVKDGVTNVLYTDKEYVFRNIDFGNDGAKYGAFNWGIESTLTLKNGEETVGTQVVYKGGTIGKLPEITAKHGYVTLGWYIGDNVIKEGDTWTYTENQTAYAKYIQEINISGKLQMKTHVTNAGWEFRLFEFNLNDVTNFVYPGSSTGYLYWNDNGPTQVTNGTNPVDITDYILVNGKTVREIIEANKMSEKYKGTSAESSPLSLGSWFAPVSVATCNDGKIEIKILNDYIANEIGFTKDWSITFKKGFELINTDNQLLTVEEDVNVYTWIAPTETATKISGVQVRAMQYPEGENAGKAADDNSYIVILSDGYAGTASTETEVSELCKENIDTTFATFDKIKIYLSKNGDPIALSTIFNGKASQSVLLQDGLFLNIKDYETTYNGSSIYKIVIESGCKLPVYNGTMVNLLVTDDEYVFYNNNYGNDDAKYMSREWLVYGEERTETTISGVQVRADKDDTERRGYLVILSDGYNGTVKKDNNIGSEFATLDKIKIYLSKNGDPVALSTIFNGYADQSIWGQNGLFISIKDYATTYNGKTIYKVVIEKDCVLPVYDGEITDWLVTDKEYVFYNKGYGADSSVNEAFGWGGKEVPETAENLGAISVSTVTYQAEEKVAAGAERGRWILIRMTENFPVNSSADVYLTFGLTDILDKIFVYTATKGENGEVTNLEIKPLGDYFKGGMTLRQFGSPADLGFCVNDQIDGTHIYAIKILKDCKIPYLTADEEYCVKTIASDVMFVNNEWGFSGEIVSTDEGGIERHYENWAINWSKACEYKFTVSGPEDVSFDSVIVKSTESIDLGAFARDGYDVSASDDNDYVYYGKIVYTGYGTANVTLTYTAKTESAGSGCSGSVGSAFGLQACFAAVVAVIIKRKRSV